MKIIEFIKNLPIFSSVSRRDTEKINTIYTKDDLETIFKYYLGGFYEYKINEKPGFMDISVRKTCKFLNKRYLEMQKFIEPRIAICLVKMHYK